jgi:hypothetical protein
MRLLRSSALTLLGLATVAWPARGRAQDDAQLIEPSAPHALGRVVVAGPAPTGPTLLATGGYGYTESVLGLGDAHHRLAGSLALDERPRPWLDLALRLDGRYDVHSIPGQPTDTGWVGDPRLFARVDRAWAGGLRLGARAGLWLPGRNAPSVDWGAITPELVGLASYAAPGGIFALTANVGYRLDRSAHTAADAAQLSAADRSALEVSAFNAILAGVGATVGRGPAQGFVEASAELLIGSGAPPVKASPILVGAGGRFAVTRNVRLEAELEVSPSSRPDASAGAPLVPIPPRLAGWLGLAYQFGAPPERPAPPPAPPPPPSAAPPPAAPSAPSPAAPSPPPAPAVEPEEAPAPPPRGQIRGLVRSLRGRVVAAQIGIEAENAGAAEAAPPEKHDLRADDGRFEFDVAPGRYRVTIAAPGYRTQTRQVDVEENGVTVLNVDLRAQR